MKARDVRIADLEGEAATRCSKCAKPRLARSTAEAAHDVAEEATKIASTAVGEDAAGKAEDAFQPAEFRDSDLEQQVN